MTTELLWPSEALCVPVSVEEHSAEPARCLLTDREDGRAP